MCMPLQKMPMATRNSEKNGASYDDESIESDGGDTENSLKLFSNVEPSQCIDWDFVLIHLHTQSILCMFLILSSVHTQSFNG